MRNRYLEKFDSRVRIRVSGNNVHNYLKRVLKKKINIYRVIPISRKEIDLILNYSEYEKLLEYKSIYEIKLLGYLGKKKWKDQLGQNSLLLFFMVLGLGLIVLLSHVVSEIEVIHQDQSMRLFLRDELERYGIKKYTFKKNYEELEKIEERILKDNKDKLEWIEIIEYGTKYTVRVEERKINQEENTYQYQHIISRKNAVIKRIDAVSGEKVKFVNDYVKKGDIIISGDVTLPDNTKVSTMAKGKVYGEVWYQVSVDYPYVYQESKLTGKSKNVYAIYFFGKKFSLFDFHQYRTFQKEKKILFSINMLDIHFVWEKQHETIVKDEVYTEDMLSAKALLYVKEKLFRDNPYIQSIEEIKVLREDSSETGVYFQMFVQVIEDIGEVLPGVKE